MVTLRYLDWLILAGISEEFLEQAMDAFDAVDLQPSEVRALGLALQQAPESIFDGSNAALGRLPQWGHLLRIHQIQDAERLKLLGELFVNFADMEERGSSDA